MAQLPDRGCNLIIFGHIEGSRNDLEDALYGMKVPGFQPNRETRRVTLVWTHIMTGAFCTGLAGEPFRPLSAILWVRLWPRENSLGRAYKLYRNPNALQPFSSDVMDAVFAVVNRWTTQEKVQELTLEDEDLFRPSA